MDPIIYFLAEHFPWWSIPSALILAELANHFRRTGQRAKCALSASASLVFIVLSVLYFTHNGLWTVRPTLQNLERQYQQ